MYGYIYKITCTDGSFSGRFYIGQRKWSGDICKDTYKGSGKMLKDYYKKYPKAYTKEVLATADSMEELDQLEKDYIHPYLNHPECLNVREGGNHCYDFPMAEETKKKLSEALKGRKVWNKGIKTGKSSHMKGKHHTDETKRKISMAKKGQESPWKGKHFSEESKEKLSIAHKGKPSWNTGKKLSPEHLKKLTLIRSKKPVVQIDRITMEIVAEYISAREASRKLGISDTTIGNCCKMRPHYKTAGGFIWRYK